MKAVNQQAKNVIQDGGHLIFTYAEANTQLKFVHNLTKQSADELKQVQVQLHVKVPADPRVEELNAQYVYIVEQWSSKMRRLGLAVHGLWQVGFDNGEGWYSWQLPDRKIRYFIEYGCSFSGRQLISR